MADLFLSNVPFDCDAPELQAWIEADGFRVKSVELIQDLVARISPSFAYVELADAGDAADAILALNRKNLRGRVLQVGEDWRARSARNAA
jgi:RNA recognition motif-containing protein